MASTGSSRRKVPFGGHQLAEYTLAAAFVAVGHPPEWAPGGRAAGSVGAVKAAEWARGVREKVAAGIRYVGGAEPPLSRSHRLPSWRPRAVPPPCAPRAARLQRPGRRRLPRRRAFRRRLGIGRAHV